MSKVVFAWLLLAAVWSAGPAVAKDPTSVSLQRGARVGVLNMLDSELAHFHASKVLSQSFLKTPAVNWPLDSLLNAAVTPRLTQDGLVPVSLAAPEDLMHIRDEVFVDSSVAKGLPRETARQLANLAAAEHLDALIVLAPSLNNSAQAGGAVRRSLPDYLRGLGFVTSDTG